MAFKLNNPPYSIDNTPVYNVQLEDGVLGKADRNGSILVNQKIKDPSQIHDVVAHEKIHVEQIKRGDLDYDDECVYWKGKCWPRKDMKEGDKNLPWEAEAYKKS
jgi:hypothetical protein